MWPWQSRCERGGVARQTGAQHMGWFEGRSNRLLATTFLITCGLGVFEAAAQQETTPPNPGAVALPPVDVDRPPPPRRPRQTTTLRARTRAPAPAASPTPAAPPANIQNGSAGTAGYLATRSSTGTKTDTPIINIPQSVSVLTKEFIKDQGFQSIGDSIRYVPGVIPHQGEGNRDDVVIRGQRSNADFFVNGIRDDVQYFRDLYNIYRIEVLKGPNAMIFGRGGGGGVINRVLKEADFVPIQELTVQGGMFDNKRISLDVGGPFGAPSPTAYYGDMPVKALPGAVSSSNWAGRINAVYENSGSFRDFVNVERYGVNPTVTYRPNDSTWVKLSYEYFHDRRTADRGIPSQFGRPYLTDPSTFFGNPNLNRAIVDAHIATAEVNHLTDSGVNIRNSTRYAHYDKFYQNIFPGGAVSDDGTKVNLSAYNNETDRQNIFNQTDVTYKFDVGWTRHTLLGGAEVGRQNGLSFRQDGHFVTGGCSSFVACPAALAVSPLNPTSYVPVIFQNIPTGANNTYVLNLAAAYLQDQIEVTRYLQFILGVRFDRFDLESQDRRDGTTFARTDNLVSPRAGVIVKPVENVSIYGSYSVSALPSSGDQFSTLNPGTAIAEPEKFTNKEVGLKWDISPRLMFATAVYDLERTNQRLNDPLNPGFFILSGKTITRGFEASLTGYVTPDWQMVGGYAYTDARIASDTSATIHAGNRVGLVPYNVFTLWNKYQVNEWFAAGLGVIYQTDFYANSDDTVRLPSFTRVDAALFGKFNKKLRWQINAENIFNRKYYSTADGNNNISPGSPFAVRGTLIASF
jgi:catecholate siderophore receptor